MARTAKIAKPLRLVVRPGSERKFLSNCMWIELIDLMILAENFGSKEETGGERWNEQM